MVNVQQLFGFLKFAVRDLGLNFREFELVDQTTTSRFAA